VSEERSQIARRIDEHQFSMNRRGYDKAEVKAYLQDLEQAFRELEGHSRRTALRVEELESDLAKARATERVSVDNAMMAVFDAKDRILERARRRAEEIEEAAQVQASQIRNTATTQMGGGDGAGSAEIAAATAQADEILASARRESDRLRSEATNDPDQDLEAELAQLTGQLRRAHEDTASARLELDSARKRIVELESSSDDAQPEHLEERFGELESHLLAARAEADTLRQELAAERDRLAAAEAEQVARPVLETTQSQPADLTAVREQADIAEFAGRMKGMQEQLASADRRRESLGLAAEMSRGSIRKDLQDSEATPSDEVNAEVEEILAAARAEAEAITLEVEEEAEQRAAKVISKAREEANQVRQTVATLTAQAEDARSAALRSKLEAEDLAEAHRSMSDARTDIVATAESRAHLIERDAVKAAEVIRVEAEAVLTKAREDADRITADAQRAAEAQLELEEAAKATVAAADEPEEHSGDDVAAMLAEAEKDVAVSAELRRQRRELEEREAEIAERERLVAAQQSETAMLLASARESAAHGADVAAERPPPPPTSLPSPPPPPPPLADDNPPPSGEHVENEPVVLDDDDDDDADDDPAERLGALLERVAPTAAPESDNAAQGLDRAGFDSPGFGEVDLGSVDADDVADQDRRPRFAWPTPVDDDDADADADTRESRYRSRSAQLPHLGSQAKSNMTAMANLRKKKGKGRD
jgi:DivIVA domain-containing protein